MDIQENISLAEHTTFKVGGQARFFCRVSDEMELLEAVAFAAEKGLPIFVLGGGSNILVSDKGFPGLVIKMEIAGIEEQGEGSRKKEEREKGEKGEIKKEQIEKAKGNKERVEQKTVIVSAGAGELWDGLVEWTVERGLYGLENLSAIPGTVGAAPVQNIGAYGAEASQTIHSVRVLHVETGEYAELAAADCRFSYRDSIFKHEKGRHIITRVSFLLSRAGAVDLTYRDLGDYFRAKKNSSNAGSPALPPTLKEVRQAVIDIRWKKLPDWKLWGTAGSYFKNPIVTAAKLAELKQRYPELPSYAEPDGRSKVSLGWILDNVCDAKGLCVGKACVYERQALVLVTVPGATAEEVVSLSRELMRRVKDRTGIEIECEVEWVN